jgi:hypothetical protein
VQRYEKSGLTQGAFAAHHRLGLSTLRKWLAQTREAGSPAPPLWQELKVPISTGAGHWVAELVRPDGVTLRVAPDAPAALIASLWRVSTC